MESVLGVRARHVLEVDNLPQLHRDPFDRMLAAQTRVERLTLLTLDPQVRRYPVTTNW